MNVKSIATSCLIASATAIQLHEQIQSQAEHGGHGGPDNQRSAGTAWDNNTVHWCRGKNVDEHRINAFERGLEQYGKALPGCIKFVEIPEKDGKCNVSSGMKSSVLVTTKHDDGCWSHMGQFSTAWQQGLNIGVGCSSMGTVLHEIAHTLGQAHEQNRADRDKSIKVDFTNVNAAGARQFDLAKTSYIEMPYDYQSIMQYSAFDFGKDRKKPVVRPINCEPYCPNINKLGNNDGFTLLDQRQTADSYHCKKSQMAIRTEEVECLDWKHKDGKPLDCAAYKAAGKCNVSVDSVRPCCNCNSGGITWGGIKSRKWVTEKTPAECKDRYQAGICKGLKADKMCWSGFVKQNCESTCDVCTKAGVQDFADVMTGRKVVPFAGGKNFVGPVDASGKPKGSGVLSWGNQVRTIGNFDGLKTTGPTMIAYPEGSVFVGTVKNSLANVGEYYPPLSVSKDAFLKGTFGANGTLATGSVQWPNGRRYTGPLSQGLATGKGKLEWEGNHYDGDWSQGKPNGSGTVFFKNGEKFTANWIAGTGTGKFCNERNECANWTLSLF